MLAPSRRATLTAAAPASAAAREDAHPSTPRPTAGPQASFVRPSSLIRTKWAAWALMLLGGCVIIGWAAHVATMVQMLPGLTAMVANAALLFFCSGLALLWLDGGHPVGAKHLGHLALFIASAGLLILAQVLSDTPLPIDWPALHRWLGDGNHHPGRMAANTALGFALTGIALSIVSQRRSARMTQLAITLSFVVLALGITGLIGYTLQLNLLYSWFRGVQMALTTAAGMVVLGLGLLEASLRRAADDDTVRPDERINLLAVLTLLTVSLSTGLAGFAAMQERARQEITHGLSTSLGNRLAYVLASLREGSERSSLLAASLGAALDLNSAAAGAKPLQALLGRQVKSAELEHIVLRKGGKVLAEHGMPLASSSFSTNVRLAAGGTSQLIWDRGLHLRSTIELPTRNGPLTLGIVRRMPAIEALLMRPTGYGRTGESAICILQDKVRCFPQSRQPQPYSAPHSPSGNSATAMSMALTGRSGIFSGLDYRHHEVISAYAPLDDTGLAMVLKQDSWEVFEPISAQLKRIAPVFLILTAAGVWLMRSQIKPLASRLVTSEARAREAHRALADEEQRIRAVLDNIGDGIITMDATGIIRSINPAACATFGYAAEELVGQELVVLMPLAMRERHHIGMKRYLEQGAARVVNMGAIELHGLRRDGTEFPIELSVTHVEDGDRVLFIGIVRDISERALVQQALHDEKERLRVTLHSIGDAVITTDTHGSVRYLNPVAQEMTGWPKDEAQGRHIAEVFHIVNESSGERAPCPVATVLATGDISAIAGHTEMICRGGERISIEESAAPIRGQDGEVSGVVIVFRDVTQQRRLAEQISYQATHDSLTDLVNRREFERRVSAALQKDDAANGAGKGLSLLYLDLDQFKLINDTCGHVAGDQLLIRVSSLIRSRLRSEDTLARLGGDEFAVLLENCPPDVALRVADKIRQSIHELQFVWQEKGFTVGASIGLVSRQLDQSLSDLLRAADSACYVAKEKGRNLVHVYRDADVELLRRSGEMGWVARIERALREDRFQLYVQPIAPLAWQAGDPHLHYEVLVRMRDEEGALVPPMAFIPAAERYGLMPRIDRWIVERALDLLEHRPADGPRFTLSINLSATSINQEDFLPFLRAQLVGRKLDAADVCFEITETAAIASLSLSSRMMHELKGLGCRFSLDDFGSGMSSFSYLKHLPVDFVKIDGSFVKDIDGDLIDRAMVGAINDIAHVMGIMTVAEFVENEAILERLRNIGVDFVQGYGIGRPIPASEIEALAAPLI